MLRRLSSQSQEIIDRAQAVARQYGQDYIDSEHVLLAIVEKDACRAGQVLRANGLTPEALRKSIESSLKKRPAETFVVGRLPGTIHFKNVIARAIELAESSNAQAVEPDHLLLALSREENTLACQALENQGLGTGKIEKILAA